MIMIILTLRPAQDEPWSLPDAAAIGAITPFSFAEIAEVISEAHAEIDDIAIDLMRGRFLDAAAVLVVRLTGIAPRITI